MHDSCIMPRWLEIFRSISYLVREPKVIAVSAPHRRDQLLDSGCGPSEELVRFSRTTRQTPKKLPDPPAQQVANAGERRAGRLDQQKPRSRIDVGVQRLRSRHQHDKYPYSENSKVNPTPQPT